ncbi:MAG: anti-sigma factor [Solirubrobacteraceae bacterium]
MTPSDNERIAYLAGEPVESLPAQDRAELDELRELLGAPATWAEPEPGLEDRVVRAIADAVRAEAGSAAPAAPTAPATRTAPAAPPRALARWRSLFRRPAFAFGALATGAAAVVAVVIVLATSGSSGPAPLHFAMVVRGTALAPGAHGNASLTKTNSGWRIELRVSGLPHIENGRFYQAWVKNPAGVLVPVGTFNDGRNVTLWSGVPITKFRTLTVTLQAANGNPASSGRRVLIGTIKPSG